MAKKIKINLGTKKTELEWQETLDDIFLKIAPKIYEWLTWVATLTALIFAHNKTNSQYIFGILIITSVFTYLYYIAYFYRFIFTSIPHIKDTKITRFISYLISAIIAYSAWHLANSAAIIIATSQS